MSECAFEAKDTLVSEWLVRTGSFCVQEMEMAFYPPFLIQNAVKAKLNCHAWVFCPLGMVFMCWSCACATKSHASAVDGLSSEYNRVQPRIGVD